METISAALIALLVSVTNVANVVDYGADPTGQVDSSQAFYDAQQASDTILVPSGTYLKNSETSILEGKTWKFDGATITHSSDTSTMFSAVDVGNWSILGHLKLKGLLTTNVDTGESGFRIVNPHRAYIERITVSLFKGDGVKISGTSPGSQRGDALTIGTLAGYENRTVLRVSAGAGAEYITINSVEMTGNIYTAIIEAGNVQINGGNIVDNYYGPWLKSGSNHGHGGLHGMNINHNTYWNLKADTVTNGFTVDSCHFYADSSSTGKIILNNSKGISIRNGIIDAPIENTGSYKNMLQNNYIAGSLTTLGGGNAANLLRSGNYNGSGLVF